MARSITGSLCDRLEQRRRGFKSPGLGGDAPSAVRRAASYARNVTSANDTVARQLAACEQIGMYLVDMQLMTDTHMEQIVAGTVGRARETFRAMCFLASQGQSVQAAMLCRSIFEDMVVAHWLVLHEDDPEFLTQRYMRQLDAIRLNEAKTTEAFGWVSDDVSDLAGREEELRKEFGNHAQWHWWAVRREGQRLTLSEVITELESSPRFQPRFQGETPVLRHMYEKARSGITSCSTIRRRECQCGLIRRSR